MTMDVEEREGGRGKERLRDRGEGDECEGRGDRGGAKSAIEKKEKGSVVHKAKPHTMIIQRLLPYYMMKLMMRGYPTPHYGTYLRMGGFPFCL